MLLWVGRLVLAVQCASVFTCTCVVVHVCVRGSPGSLWPHHHCVSQPQPVQTCTLSCQPQCTFSVSHTQSCTRSHSLGPGILWRRGKLQSWHICLNIDGDSIHLDLLVLKYPSFVLLYSTSNVIFQTSTLSLWLKKRTCMWFRVPPPLKPYNFCSSAVVQLSVLLHLNWKETGYKCTLLLRRALLSTKRVL